MQCRHTTSVQAVLKWVKGAKQQEHTKFAKKFIQMFIYQEDLLICAVKNGQVQRKKKASK